MTDPSKKAETLTKARSAKNEMERLAPVQMSFWHDETRAIANELARCALFSCRDVRKPRNHYLNQNLSVLGKGLTVTYTGEELRAYDEALWLTLAHLAREQFSGEIMVKISNAEICRLNRWPAKQAYYSEIFKSMQRLKSATLTVMSQRLTKSRAYEQARQAGASDEELARLYDELQAFDRNEDPPANVKVSGLMLSMIGDKVKFMGGNDLVDDIPQGNLQWEVPLAAEMVSLFAKPYLTLVPFETRRKLSMAARRLQAYYMGHKEPFDVLVSSLGKLLDLDSPLKDQKRVVRKCLDELIKYGVLLEATIEEGRGDVKVHVVRNLDYRK